MDQIGSVIVARFSYGHKALEKKQDLLEIRLHSIYIFFECENFFQVTF